MESGKLRLLALLPILASLILLFSDTFPQVCLLLSFFSNSLVSPSSPFSGLNGDFFKAFGHSLSKQRKKFEKFLGILGKVGYSKKVDVFSGDFWFYFVI